MYLLSSYQICFLKVVVDLIGGIVCGKAENVMAMKDSLRPNSNRIADTQNFFGFGCFVVFSA